MIVQYVFIERINKIGCVVTLEANKTRTCRVRVSYESASVPHKLKKSTLT